MDGAQALFDAPQLWFRLRNRLNDPFDLCPAGSHADMFGTIGVFCLSSTYTSAPMWAHYADCGKGVVLEFQTSDVFFKQYPAIKVRYSNTRPAVRNVHKALTTKNKEWTYEQEWRCFSLLPPWNKARGTHFLAAQQAIAVPFPTSALTSIIHGYDSRVNTSRFLARADCTHVLERVCRQDPYKFAMNLRSLDSTQHLSEYCDAAQWGRE